jgi:hypothetical protein
VFASPILCDRLGEELGELLGEPLGDDDGAALGEVLGVELGPALIEVINNQTEDNGTGSMPEMKRPGVCTAGK